MLKIVKYGCELNIPNNCIATIDAAYDGIRVILNDRTEISFQMNVTQQVKAILPIVKGCSVGNVTLNLDEAIAGRYDSVLSMSMPSSTPLVTTPMVEKKDIPDTLNVVKTKSTTKKTTKKPVGRPKKK